MKNRDSLKVSALRMILAALKNEQIAKRRLLSEAEEVQVLQKEVKKRQDSIEWYKRGNRQKLAEREIKEAEIIKEYLPSI
ncbi:GatB/YqeY domain-containing protein [Microgenomates group bacterium]|nr:GatB/YqeY domain-containing protein [Microgenomates group bacterium]